MSAELEHRRLEKIRREEQKTMERLQREDERRKRELQPQVPITSSCSLLPCFHYHVLHDSRSLSRLLLSPRVHNPPLK